MNLWNVNPDFYILQHLALLPTTGTSSINKIRTTLQDLPDKDQKQLLEMILNQGLHFFWAETLLALPTLKFSICYQQTIKDSCFKTTYLYLAQKKALLDLDKLLEAEQISYVVFKGVHVREVVYENPAVRPSVDIDILVSPNQKVSAVRVLCANGYSLIANKNNVSHEISLIKESITLDLHWHILRPGRTRIELTDLLLQSQQRCGFFWAPDNETTLLIMLTHSVFTKYSTGPQALLVRLVDISRWVINQEINYQRLLHLIEISGLKTAVWVTATILANLTDCRFPDSFCEAIKPGNPKRFLLNNWLRMNLSLRFANYPIFPKYIFTLLAHDKLSDIVRFTRIFREEQQKAEAALEKLVQASGNSKITNSELKRLG